VVGSGIGNGSASHTWRCAEGHEWMANPSNVRQGSWCPVCSLGLRRRGR
jgi:hypothetical protein